MVKIDLKAMKTKHSEKNPKKSNNEIKKEIEREEVEKNIKPLEGDLFNDVNNIKNKEKEKPKINLSNIKKNNKKNKIKENEEEEIKPKINNNETILVDKNNINNEKTENSIKNSSEKTENSIKNSSEKTENDATKNEKLEGEIFKEYKSDFENEKIDLEKKIETKVEEYKNRFNFLLAIIFTFIIGLVILYLINPLFFNDKIINPIKKYVPILNNSNDVLINKTKNNIVNNSEKEKIDKNTNNKSNIEKIKENKKILETELKKDEIIKDGFVISYEKTIKDGKTIIKHNNKIYTKDQFSKELDNIIKEIKKEKLKNFLKNN